MRAPPGGVIEIHIRNNAKRSRRSRRRALLHPPSCVDRKPAELSARPGATSYKYNALRRFATKVGYAGANWTSGSMESDTIPGSGPDRETYRFKVWHIANPTPLSAAGRVYDINDKQSVGAGSSIRRAKIISQLRSPKRYRTHDRKRETPSRRNRFPVAQQFTHDELPAANTIKLDTLSSTFKTVILPQYRKIRYIAARTTAA
ncbi:MAG: hypothetical protein ACLTZY_13505 [Alistipes indistinctus]